MAHDLEVDSEIPGFGCEGGKLQENEASSRDVGGENEMHLREIAGESTRRR